MRLLPVFLIALALCSLSAATQCYVGMLTTTNGVTTAGMYLQECHSGCCKKTIGTEYESGEEYWKFECVNFGDVCKAEAKVVEQNDLTKEGKMEETFCKGDLCNTNWNTLMAGKLSADEMLIRPEPVQCWSVNTCYSGCCKNITRLSDDLTPRYRKYECADFGCKEECTDSVDLDGKKKECICKGEKCNVGPRGH